MYNGCNNHEPFLNPYLSPPKCEKPTTISISFSLGRLLFNAFFNFDNGDHHPARIVELLLLHEEGSGPGLALGRRFNDGFIDTKLLNQWKRRCDDHHGNKCSDRLATLSHPLSYLIDTQQMCLVPAAPNVTYVALSYVWGQVRMLKTTRENLESLQSPQSLQALEGQLPRTIRDSIRLVPLLDERYLWVDSLCIPQDDEKEVQLNIGQMAAIFENASLTIVACDGEDAEFGLRGLRHSSQPRSLPGLLSLAPGITLTTRREDILSGTPWSQRGWTLQEQIFSRRSIIFYENTVQWICRSSRHYEDVDSPDNLPPGLPAGARFKLENEFEQLNPLDLSLNVPDLSILGQLISNYTRRYLTYQGDVMPAIASTFGAMQKAFPRGFIQGLPISFFDASLIWRSEPTVRRESSRNGVRCPPSWTWAGWKGRLWPFIWDSATYIKIEPRQILLSSWVPFQVIPMLVWGMKDSRDSEEKRIPFQNEWHDYKSKFMGKSHNLPEGWTYHRSGKVYYRLPELQKGSECQTTRDELHTPYYYVHESCPHLRFWHPVPIGTNQDHKGHWEVAQSQYLCARTQKARLWAAMPHRDEQVKGEPLRGDGSAVVRMFGLKLPVSLVLRDQMGDVVGELRPDLEGELQ